MAALWADRPSNPLMGIKVLARHAGVALAMATSGVLHAEAAMAAPGNHAPSMDSRWVPDRPSPDPLVAGDLAGLKREDLLDQLVDPQDVPRVRQVGARYWANNPGHVVALVCVEFTESQEMGTDVPAADEGSCRTDQTYQILGVLRVDGESAPQLLAKFHLDADVLWPALHWDSYVPMSVDLEKSSELPEEWSSFDLANYALSDEGPPAFGLRGVWSEGYSGGGASFSALFLFQLDDGRLDPIFSVPIGMERDLAGEWNEDGTRQRDTAESSSIVIVEPTTTHGLHDLRVRERQGRSVGTIYRATTSRGYYQPAEK